MSGPRTDEITIVDTEQPLKQNTATNEIPTNKKLINVHLETDDGRTRSLHPEKNSSSYTEEIIERLLPHCCTIEFPHSSEFQLKIQVNLNWTRRDKLEIFTNRG